ncbi:MAG: hypothetical protein JWO80_2373 [Bryobacterales bacterium]|nr:hypothetical protein [Bryobacterales bacterium]
MKTIRVESPGLFTTVQDLGRPGFGPIGVSASGACDPIALRVGNLLLGNTENAAGLEMTLQGGRYLFPEGAMISLGGSDFGATVDGSPVPVWVPREVMPGQVLTVGRSQSGARAYLCVRGGVAVPLVLGSASTHILSGLGGLEGRPLRKGDVLPIGPEPERPPRRGVRESAAAELGPRKMLRVTDGPQTDWFADSTISDFYASTYTVTPEANRMGLRLEGKALASGVSGDMMTEGVSLGCIQVPSGGQPVILFVEQQTTGGYPKIANVIAADLPSVGQLKPGDQIRFVRLDLREARELLYMQERLIRTESSYL